MDATPVLASEQTHEQPVLASEQTHEQPVQASGPPVQPVPSNYAVICLS